jgi:predicted  nucleic acid-binding Zn-ribbon protein
MPSTKQDHAMQQQVSVSVRTLVIVALMVAATFFGYHYYTSAMATKAQHIEKTNNELTNAKAKLVSLEAKLNELKNPNAIEAVQELVTGKKQDRLDKIQATEKERLILVKTRDDLKQELENLGK